MLFLLHPACTALHSMTEMALLFGFHDILLHRAGRRFCRLGLRRCKKVRKCLVCHKLSNINQQLGKRQPSGIFFCRHAFHSRQNCDQIFLVSTQKQRSRFLNPCQYKVLCIYAIRELLTLKQRCGFFVLGYVGNRIDNVCDNIKHSLPFNF
nr:MAG TPA: hypothetical protein [Caudoviricetes sp.]